MFHDRSLTAGTALSRPSVIRGVRFQDAMQTYDRSTIDSTGNFLIGQLERFDTRLHEPLVSFTWSRDIDVREDVTIADDATSFTQSNYAATGGINPNGKNWVGRVTNAISGVAVDIGKIVNPLHPWGMELSYTVFELARSQRLGTSIDVQKLDAINLKWNMDTDEQVYTGDSSLPSCYGLFNNPAVTPQSVAATGTGATTPWINKTPVQLLADVNEILTTTWQASGWKFMPTELRLPPAQYSYLVSTLISTAGNQSVLRFLLENNLAVQNGKQLNIQPVKWLIGRGAGGTPGVLGTVDRMVAYTKQEDLIRFPMTELLRTPLEYRSLYQICTYYGQLGQIEFIYPETLGYRDGI